MTTSTFATVSIPASAQAQAQADLPGQFTAPYTTDPDGAAPATNYVSSGYWLDTELDFVVNDATWPKTVLFGDAQAAIAALGLYPVAGE
jgi:hypothetical protein